MSTRRISPASLARLIGGWHSQGGRLPAYRQLQQAVRLLILDGRLPIGIRLPGERQLAAELGLSRTTITTAFSELRELGFIASRHGSGSVTRLPRAAGKPQAADDQADGIEFSIAALPAPKEVHLAFARALAELPQYLPTTGYEPAGLHVLRLAIAERYCRRGLETRPDQILVTQGAQHGLVLLLATLTRPGDQLVVDHPTYSKALEAIAFAACRPVAVPLPHAGWDIDHIAAALAQTEAKLAYLLPDFHNPTGRCMDEFSRARLARIAAERQCRLIVDETMADLWLDRPPPPSLAVFDREGRVITLGSMGKSFWGGLRIGWIRGAPELVAALAAARAANDMGSPILEQLAAAALLEEHEAALDERRAAVRGQRDHLIALIGDRLPEWTFEAPSGGLSIWAELPQPVSTALAAAANGLGLRIAPGGRFGVDGAFERFVRLPYALPEDQLSNVVELLVRAWAKVASGLAAAPGPPARLTAAI